MANPIKELLQSKKSEENDNYVLQLHHALMCKYGWIPFEEFKRLPIPTVVGLIDCINEDIEAEKKAREKAGRK